MRIVMMTGLLLALAGCIPPAVTPGGAGGPIKDTNENSVSGDRLEIEISSACGIYGGPAFRSEWVLVKNGSCLGTVTHGSNAGGFPAAIKKHEVPAEVFDQCVAKLRETNFYWMRERSEPATRFENGGSSIKVKWKSRERLVSVTEPAKPPAGYEKLWAFVVELEKRGKELPASPSPTTENAPGN
jgi:hypothetical protein